MKQCPICAKIFDESWNVCLYCSKPLGAVTAIAIDCKDESALPEKAREFFSTDDLGVFFAMGLVYLFIELVAVIIPLWPWIMPPLSLKNMLGERIPVFDSMFRVFMNALMTCMLYKLGKRLNNRIAWWMIIILVALLLSLNIVFRNMLYNF